MLKMSDEIKNQEEIVKNLIQANNLDLSAARITTSDGHIVDALGKNVNMFGHVDTVVNEIHVHSDEVSASSENSTSQPTPTYVSPQNIPVGLIPVTVNCDYFNLIVVGAEDFTTGRTTLRDDRVINNHWFTENFILDTHMPLNPDNKRKLCSYPTIFCAEMLFTDGSLGSCPDKDQMAKFGFIKRVSAHGREVWIDYDVNKLQDFPQCEIFNNLDELDIDSRPKVTELSHTHWAIKNVNVVDFLRNKFPNLILPVPNIP